MMKELVDAYQKALEHEFGALAPLASMLGKFACRQCARHRSPTQGLWASDG